MEQAPPQFGRTVSDRDAPAAALRLDPGRQGLLDDVPAQVVSTGAAHLLVPARDRAVVDHARPDGPQLVDALAQAGGQGCYLYCLDAQGVVRDGATLLVAQGHAMGRPSRIRVQVNGQQVRIGGASVVVAEGTLTI
jgi:trans-2,3-dihydro-3-hydroxyanthranilate isomerase